ncbi:Coatomer subunit beta' [Bulinus truncatus]|nr:Coatomer subunit beta' [Bulinus truncatus]
MDVSGKILWAKQFEIQQANIKTLNDQEIKEGERLCLAVKDMGTCEIFPLSVSHSPNGRFAVVCGEGEYIIYTGLTLRSKAYGQAQDFVWSSDSSIYATHNRDKITIFKNFKESKSLKPTLGVSGIFGGHLLGVKSNNCLTFYDWESGDLIRRIEIEAKHVFWNETNSLVCLSDARKFHILHYNSEAIELSKTLPEKISDDGIEDTFEVLNETSESVSTGTWIGDCFLYTNNINRLSYCVGGEVTTIAHLDRPMYLLGYLPKENRVFLTDKELGIVSYRLWLSVLEYQTAVVRKDFDIADKILPSVPPEQRNHIALFLECQGFKQQALAVSNDTHHKFELSIQLNDLKTAHILAQQSDSVDQWKELADLALKQSDFILAQECLQKSQDWEALVLLASSTCNRELMSNVAHLARQAEKTNVEFLASFLLGRLEDCLELLIKSDRLPEAAFFAYSYLPSEISRVVLLWRAAASKINKRKADAIADPGSWENLFPNYKFLIKAEEFLKAERSKVIPASTYSDIPNILNHDLVRELMEAENNGQLANDTDEEVEGFVKIQAWSPGQETPPFVEIETGKEILTISTPQNISLENHNELAESISAKQAKSKSEIQTVNESKTEESGFVMDEVSMALLQQELDLDLDNLNIDEFDITELDSVELLDDLNDDAGL